MDEAFIGQCLPRDDAYIGILEMAAVWLLLETFGPFLQGHRVSLFIDNQGCLQSIVRAASRSPEMNRMVCHLWLYTSRRQIDLRLFYVESKANPADGPSRHDLQLLWELAAVEVQPLLPAWIFDIWSFSLVQFVDMLRES